MYLRYDSELERPYPTPFKGKEETYKPSGEIAYCGKGVGGVHSTNDYADSKTAYREGTLLYSSFQWR
jgi:hypothetical protein